MSPLAQGPRYAIAAMYMEEYLLGEINPLNRSQYLTVMR